MTMTAETRCPRKWVNSIMPHHIETHPNQAAAIFARADPWHRLGVTVRDRAFTAEEAMTLGHLGGCYAAAPVMPL